MKKWEILTKKQGSKTKNQIEAVIDVLLKNRGLKTKKEIDSFLVPPNPYTLTPKNVDVDPSQLAKAIERIRKAIKNKESMVVYADYDADGITAGAIMWETLHALGANIMPYIPHRVDEGYGLSQKGIDTVRELYDPALIITVDHGITAWEKVAYAKKYHIDVIVTDHHVKPEKLPECSIIHTTKLAGSGVSWFLAKEIVKSYNLRPKAYNPDELVALTAIGTIADMVPLVGPNRSIAKYGLAAINATARVGLDALMIDAALTKGVLGTYEVSHVLAPRLNAMGRIEHALDALRLLCTNQKEKAALLAQKLGLTNKERQQMTIDTTIRAKDQVKQEKLHETKKLLFVAHEQYNQGVIGLVAGKLVEEYYLPSIVISKGEQFSKASARSIAGFNIVEAIRSMSDILVDVGGHPMAAGFTVETKNLLVLKRRLEEFAASSLSEEMLTRTLKIEAEIPLGLVTAELWQKLRGFEPFGFGNQEPVFATRKIKVKEARLVGADGKHLKLRITSDESPITMDAIAFGFGNQYGELNSGVLIDIAYTIDMNVWNGNKNLQLKIKDIHLPS